MSRNSSALPGRRRYGNGTRPEIARLGPWFHNLHLPDGSETRPDHPFGDFPAFKWREIAPHLPERLDGWHALDVGCNAGFYSIELARRGARVTGIDIDEHYLDQARWAARECGVGGQIELRKAQIYDLAREKVHYDLVLFMGVLYHLRYPMLGLDIVSEKVRKLMVFQTLTMPGMAVTRNTEDRPIERRDDLRRPGWPKLAFIEHRFAGDPTNWWVPNHAAVEAMLRSSGFRVITRPGHEIYVCERAPREPSPIQDLLRRELDSATGRA